MNPTHPEGNRLFAKRQRKQSSKAAKETICSPSLTDARSWYVSFQVWKQHHACSSNPKPPRLPPSHTAMPLEDMRFKPLHPKTATEGWTFSWRSFVLSAGRKGKATRSRTHQQTKRGEAIPKSLKNIILLNIKYLLKCSWKIKIYTVAYFVAFTQDDIQELSLSQINGKEYEILKAYVISGNVSIPLHIRWTGVVLDLIC